MKLIIYPGVQSCLPPVHIRRIVLRCFFVMVLAFSLLPVLHTSAAGVIYVDAAATGANNGTSWADAYTSLQSALAETSISAIWIAQGTYKPTSTTNRVSTFTVKSGMSLYGGFPTGGGDGTFAERDSQNYVTILSGEIGTSSALDNSFHVVTISTADATTLLDGLTIRGGNATDTSGMNSMGGGIHLVSGNATFRNLRLEANQSEGYGGGMFIGGGNPLLEHVTFANNRVNSIAYAYQGYGGGLHIQGGSHATLQEVLFSGNYARTEGGGMAVSGNSSPVLRSIRFEDNNSNSGGGLYIGRSSPILRAVIFENNRASANGGGIDVWGQGNSTLVDVLFLRNQAGTGAGLTVRGEDIGVTSATLFNAAFLGNTAHYGGGIFAWDGTVNLNNAILVGNTAARITSPDTGDYAGWGGGIETEYHSTIYMRNVTFASNQAYTGQSLYCESNFQSDHYIYNSILWGTANREISCANIIEDHSIRQTNQPPDSLFVQMPDPGADETWGTEDDQYGDLHVQVNSPAIDGGSNARVGADKADLDTDGNITEILPFDLDYAPRISGAAVDIGAYEHNFNHAPILSAPLSLAEILEDNLSPPGVQIGALLNGHASDADGDALGLAIISAESEVGSWQFSLDGMTWQELGLVSELSATLLGPDGWVRFLPHHNENGTAQMTVRAWDQSDGHAPGASGVDVSTNGQTTPYSAESSLLNITIVPVNDAPSFDKDTDLIVLEDSGPQFVPGWASQVLAGPEDESGQSLAFILTNNNEVLFSSQPAITSEGNLTFTPAAHVYGAAEVTMRLFDDGGTANGGVDISQPQTFMIQVTPMVDNTITLSANPNPAVYQKAVVLTAHVEGRALGTPAIPTGTVTFFDGSTIIGSASLQPVLPSTGPVAEAILSISTLVAGDHTLKAVYSGDGAYHNVTTSELLALSINPANAVINVGSLNQTYSGTCHSVSFSTTPAGLDVHITYDGSSDEPVNAGSYSVFIEVTNPNYSGSASATLTIQKAGLSVKADDKARVYGAANPPLSYTITGFINDETTAELSGSPHLTTPVELFSPPDTYPIMISLGTLQAQNYSFTFHQGNLVIDKAGTHSTLDVSDSSIVTEQPVTFTATVAPLALATGNPTGTITFLDNETVLDMVPLVDGKVELTIFYGSAGTHVLEIIYSGDGNFLPDSSDIQILTVAGVADLSVSMGTSVGYVYSGSDLIYTLTIFNDGPNLATQVVVTDTLAAGLILNSMSEGCTADGPVVTCVVGTLANGSSATIQIDVTVPIEIDGELFNAAEVTSDEIDLYESNNSATLRTPVSPEPRQIFLPCIFAR